MENLTLRILDTAISVGAILVTFPIMLLIAAIGYLINGSPLFCQTRVGMDQKPFTLVKFRTMAINTASVGTHLVDATSITGFGRLLRRTKLDELPQLFNVVAGHMSLVGPRPCLFNQLKLIEERQKRGVYEVRPGITGLAQIYGVDMSTPRKLARYDHILIKHSSLALYLRILIATALGKGRGDRVIQANRDSQISELHARQ